MQAARKVAHAPGGNAPSPIRGYTPLRDLPLPQRPKRASEILAESAARARAAGDLVAAHKLDIEAQKAMVAEARQ